MSSYITDVPAEVSSAGTSFSFDVWTPGTVVTLCNVPWDAQYNNIVDFPDTKSLIDYLSISPGPKIKFDRLSYVRPEQDIHLNIGVAQAYKYNYIHVYNPLTHSDTPNDFFYFIKGVQHIAPNTTAFHLQIDVWNSFRWGMKFGRCYVERSHYAFAVSNAAQPNMLKNLLVPEGLDCGSDMVETKYIRHKIKQQNELSDLAVVFISSADLSVDPGSIDSPNLSTSPGTKIQLYNKSRDNAASTFVNVVIGADLWGCSVDSFADVMTALKRVPWASKSIYGAYLVPAYRNMRGVTPEKFLNHNPNVGKLYEGTFIYYYDIVKDLTSELMAHIPDRYKKLMKFATYPYAAIEMTTYTGTPIILKPELFNSGKYSVSVNVSVIPPNPRVVIYPLNYGARGRATSEYVGGYLDSSTMVMNFPSLPITNDSYTDYLASNHNSIAFQHQSADWAQQRALMGANTAFSNSMLGIDANNQRTNTQIHTNTMQAGLASETANYKAIQNGINAGVNGIASMAGGNILGGALSGVMGVGNAIADNAIQQNQISGNLGIQNYSASANNNITNNLSRGIADANLALAKATAAGDHANTIAGINAKVQDAKMLQPSVSGQLGGDFLTICLEQGMTVNFRFKRVDDSAVERLGEYWLRYGYALNRYVNIKNINPMTNFTYWKLADVTIKTLYCPEVYKQAIMGIFLKGTTVWRKPEFINDLDIAENEIVGGIGSVVL